MEKIHFQITPIQKEANGEKMKVTIQIPTSEGWIDNVYLHFIKGKSIYLPFQRKENGYAIFENTFYLETKAIYSYYFSYKKEGIYCEVKDIDNTPYKLSVNFSVPVHIKKETTLLHNGVNRLGCNLGGSPHNQAFHIPQGNAP